MNGLWALAKRRPPDDVLDVIETVIEVSEDQEGDARNSPLSRGVADALARSLDQRPDDVDMVRYAAVLDRWVTVQHEAFARIPANALTGIPRANLPTAIMACSLPVV